MPTDAVVPQADASQLSVQGADSKQHEAQASEAAAKSEK